MLSQPSPSSVSTVYRVESVSTPPNTCLLQSPELCAFRLRPCSLSLQGLGSRSREEYQSNADIKCMQPRKADPTNEMGSFQCYKRLQCGLSQT